MNEPAIFKVILSEFFLICACIFVSTLQLISSLFFSDCDENNA